MRSEAFWRYFDQEARPRLGIRGDTFAKMFDYLDRFDHRVWIIETGCVRQRNNWAGDGGSTILFDKYAEFHDGAIVHSVDIDPAATSLCRELVSDRVTLHTGDSIRFLKSLAEGPPKGLQSADLVYLDSFDLNLDDVFPSAFHHIKELIAVSPLLRPDTLVVVDDSPQQFFGYFKDGGLQIVGEPKVSGKGKLVADYARQIGAQAYFSGYQCGWIKMRGS